MPGPDRTASAAGSSRHREYDVQPPRPPNAWILYRSYKFALIRQTSPRISQANVSKMISVMWQTETEEVKRHFERMADDRKTAHQQQFPDYRFAPKKKEDKIRSKAERKPARRAPKSKSKARVATPADKDAPASAAATMLALPPMPYMSQPFLPPGYQPNMILPHQYLVHNLPEAYYGLGGPSPQISAAASPATNGSCESLEVHPYLQEDVVSSSSSPPVRSPSSSESQTSSSSSERHTNLLYLPPRPSLHQPSPSPYATQPLPTLLFQPSAPGELPLGPPQVQPPPAENTVAPAATVWNNIPIQLSTLYPQNSEAVNFNIPVNEPQSFAQFPQNLHGMLSTTKKNGAFNLSNVETSNLLAHPRGDLEVAMGPQPPTIDCNEELFATFDLAEFQQQLASFTESNSSSAVVASPVEEDLHSLFRTPNNPEMQAYTAARQRQPSDFAQDMMHFFNFDGAEGTIEDTCSTVSPAPLAATVTPEQVRLPTTEHPAAMPIFSQMTNTSSTGSGTSYVPPAGAIYSSTRRVAGSWKPSFVIVPSQMGEPVQSWMLSTD